VLALAAPLDGAVVLRPEGVLELGATAALRTAATTRQTATTSTTTATIRASSWEAFMAGSGASGDGVT
jgi:hypothetical protein